MIRIMNVMFKKFPAARRVLIYVILSYLGLVLVNNSGLQYDNMWLIYAPMFIGVYIFSRWVDSRLGVIGEAPDKVPGEVSDGSSGINGDPASRRGFSD